MTPRHPLAFRRRSSTSGAWPGSVPAGKSSPSIGRPLSRRSAPSPAAN
ncbi:hypothetical protein ACFPRL_15365 [Pseudoclavibacter helvolus]